MINILDLFTIQYKVLIHNKIVSTEALSSFFWFQLLMFFVKSRMTSFVQNNQVGKGIYSFVLTGRTLSGRVYSQL